MVPVNEVWSSTPSIFLVPVGSSMWILLSRGICPSSIFPCLLVLRLSFNRCWVFSLSARWESSESWSLNSQNTFPCLLLAEHLRAGGASLLKTIHRKPLVTVPETFQFSHCVPCCCDRTDASFRNFQLVFLSFFHYETQRVSLPIKSLFPAHEDSSTGATGYKRWF